MDFSGENSPSWCYTLNTTLDIEKVFPCQQPEASESGAQPCVLTFSEWAAQTGGEPQLIQGRCAGVTLNFSALKWKQGFCFSLWIFLCFHAVFSFNSRRNPWGGYAYHPDFIEEREAWRGLDWVVSCAHSCCCCNPLPPLHFLLPCPLQMWFVSGRLKPEESC